MREMSSPSLAMWSIRSPSAGTAGGLRYLSGSIPLLCAALVSCGEPPPPVTAFILDRVTTEPSTVTLGSRRAEVLVASVPRGFFQNTARPLLGRTFAAEEFTGSPAVCIISYPLWERFGSGESDAPLVVGNRSLEVIGVMPEDFDIPEGVVVWVPLVAPVY